MSIKSRRLVVLFIMKKPIGSPNSQKEILYKIGMRMDLGLIITLSDDPMGSYKPSP